MKEKILLSWSGGKDSCMTLYELKKTDRHQIVSLLTTVTDGYDRISMHGVRRTLLQRQAEGLGLTLQQFPPDAVHADPVVPIRDRRQQGNNPVTICFLQLIERHATVFSAAPGQEYVFFHGRDHSPPMMNFMPSRKSRPSAGKPNAS